MHIRVTVDGGRCFGNIHNLWDVFEVKWTTPAGICIGAWDAISASIYTLLCGGDFPWEKEKGVTRIHCPDPNGITFELRRIED